MYRVRFLSWLLFFLLFSRNISYGAGLWERMCGACHDGSTVLNGKVVPNKEQIKAKYKSLDDLVEGVTCKTPPCMNILKHDEKLVRKAGKEIGIEDADRK